MVPIDVQHRDALPDPGAAPQRWMARWLRAAAIYNALWGAYAILWPSHYFALVGVPAPRYPELWQCIGMIVGVYGVGYWIAARAPLRHWPIVLVGLLGKVLGPLGFFWALLMGSLPWSFAWTLLANDLVWWPAFAMIMWAAAKDGTAPAGSAEAEERLLREELAAARSSEGRSVLAHSEEAPQLVVFLRHFGCIFCREALAELGRRRREIEVGGSKLLLVHLGSHDEGERYLREYGLAGCPHVSDPGARLYRAFRLRRGSFGQLFGPRTWLRGLRALLGGHLVGAPSGDGFQMPGVFLVRGGCIVREYRHAHAGAVPDYRELASCPVGTP